MKADLMRCFLVRFGVHPCVPLHRSTTLSDGLGEIDTSCTFDTVFSCVVNKTSGFELAFKSGKASP